MTQRRGMVSYWSLDTIDGWDRALHCSAFEALAPVDTHSLLYGAMLQAGLHGLDLMSLEPGAPVTNPVLRGRIRYRRANVWVDSVRLVMEAFERHRLRVGRHSKLADGVMDAERFLIDLLCAYRSGTSLVVMLGIPKLEDFREGVGAGLALPLESLWRSIRPAKVTALMPRWSLTRDEAADFEEVVHARLFDAYVQEQFALEQVGVPLEMVLASIAAAARRLESRRRRRLRVASSGVRLVQAGLSLAGVPRMGRVKELFDALQDASADWTRRKRRIVIYDAGPALEALLRARIREMQAQVRTGRR